MRLRWSSVVRRAASVGCAVNTGRTETRDAISAISLVESPASVTAAAARASHPRPVPAASRARDRWTCSVTLARWKYATNARTRRVASSMVRASSNRAVSSRSRLLPARTVSTRSRTCWPSTRVSVSPSNPTTRRMSFRRAASSSDASLISLTLRACQDPAEVQAAGGSRRFDFCLAGLGHLKSSTRRTSRFRKVAGPWHSFATRSENSAVSGRFEFSIASS